jgi:hypothetical protein
MWSNSNLPICWIFESFVASPTEQNVSYLGRGVLAYRPMGSAPCNRDLS